MLARLAVSALVLVAVSCGGGGEGAVRIASPADGATVSSPVAVALETEGFTLEPAGAVREGAGHLHLIVDEGCAEAGSVVPADETHHRLEDGTSDARLSLAPGEHRLCLQAARGDHTALDLTHEITITVGGAGSSTETSTTGPGRAEEWQGSYTGTVVWDCGAAGERRGTLEATFAIAVDEQGTATLRGSHTVTGSCAGATTGALTTPISVTGERTPAGFEFPAALWGPPGSVTIAVTDERGRGRLSGPAPGPATIVLDFAVRCVSC